MLLKVKPEVIIKDMKHHPEIFNKTGYLSNLNQFIYVENKSNKIDLFNPNETNKKSKNKLSKSELSPKQMRRDILMDPITINIVNKTK